MKHLNLTWAKAAAVRAIKTAAQVALGMITMGMAWSDVNWAYVLSVSAVSALLSILTSIAGLPEAKTVGTLEYNELEKDGDSEVYHIDVPADLDPKDGEILSFQVKRG